MLFVYHNSWPKPNKPAPIPRDEHHRLGRSGRHQQLTTPATCRPWSRAPADLGAEVTVGLARTARMPVAKPGGGARFCLCLILASRDSPRMWAYRAMEVLGAPPASRMVYHASGAVTLHEAFACLPCRVTSAFRNLLGPAVSSALRLTCIATCQNTDDSCRCSRDAALLRPNWSLSSCCLPCPHHRA